MGFCFKIGPSVVKENAAKLVEICVESESVKSLRSQSLNGFYTLLSFDNILTDFSPIVKCLWHSIWINTTTTSDLGLDDEKFVQHISNSSVLIVLNSFLFKT